MIKPIVQFPHEVLLTPCQALTGIELGTPEFLDLCNDLRDTLASFKNGVGLAANQIGVSKRVFLLKGHGIFVNPEIISYRGKRLPDKEGCLSAPSITGYVTRHDRIRVSYWNYEGKITEKDLVGFTARVAQHEMDHLNGIMFTEKIDIVSEQTYAAELSEFKQFTKRYRNCIP